MRKSKNICLLNDSVVAVERFVQQFSVVLAFLLSFFAAFIIVITYTPIDISDYSNILLPSTLESCLPENEIMAYAAFIVLFPLNYILFLRLLRKKFGMGICTKVVGAAEFINFIWSIIVLFSSLVIFVVFYITKGYASLYLYGRENIFFVIICVAFVFLLNYACHQENLCVINRFISITTSVLFVAFIFFAVRKYNYMNSYNIYSLHHYSAWWFPIYKVGSGLTLGDGFNELYGFYPYLVVPVLKLLGGVNQHSLSIYIAFVYALMAVCLLGFCNHFFKNKLLATIGVAGAFALGPMEYISNSMLYFQYYPTRALFVFLVLGLIALYSSFKRTRVLFFFIGVMLCAIGMVWNTESGIVATVLWAVFLVFEKALDYRLNEKQLIKRILLAVGSVVISVVAFVLIVEFITYTRSGIFLGVHDILFGILTFSGMGFFMYPLSIGIWLAVASALFYGLYITVPNLAISRRKGDCFTGDRDFVTAMFTVSVAGIGSFSYFMGRSISTNSMTFLPWVVMICSLLIDEDTIDFDYFTKIITKKKSCSFIKLSGIVVKNVMCFTVVGISLCATLAMAGLVFDNERGANVTFNDEQLAFSQAADQIKDWKEECKGKTPHILHTYGSFIQELMGVPAKENVYEQINWFRYSDAYSYIDYINSHNKDPFVIDSSAVEKLETYFPNDWSEIEKTYELRESSSIDVYNTEEEMEYYLYVPYYN